MQKHRSSSRAISPRNLKSGTPSGLGRGTPARMKVSLQDRNDQVRSTRTGTVSSLTATCQKSRSWLRQGRQRVR